MDTFRATALLLTIFWFLGVLLFRRSKIMLAGGLIVIGLYTIAALGFGEAVPEELGLSLMIPWLQTAAFSAGGLIATVAYSPLADRLASRWFPEPPRLEAFQSLQKSKTHLVLGIITAWVLGGILEEVIARGIVLASLFSVLSAWLPDYLAAASAIITAALGAGFMHLYQGKRAMIIISQISALFGTIFVLSGFNLLAVIICHGLYDTIAFVRFANKTSRYAKQNALARR